jgi:hypothetical protein
VLPIITIEMWRTTWTCNHTLIEKRLISFATTIKAFIKLSIKINLLRKIKKNHEFIKINQLISIRKLKA